MKRSNIARKTPLARGAWIETKRRPLPSRSVKMKAATDERRDVRMALTVRDGGRCVLDRRGDPWPDETVRMVAFLGPCGGPIEFGHIEKASQGGPYVLANGLSECRRHNAAIETEPAVAHLLGLVMRRGETLELCAEMRRKAGLTR